jgi:hypothetical protein
MVKASPPSNWKEYLKGDKKKIDIFTHATTARR